MSKYTKYRLYQKYETRGSQEAIPCYPNVFSIDGDGTMPLVIVEENSRDCGYTGETQPIYRWYTLPIDTYYYCDACQDAQYKWVNLPISQDWECDGTTKYYKQKKQVSVDGGSTWTDVVPPQYQRGAVYEYNSSSCGYITRTTSGTPYCEGYDKWVDVYTQVSSDGGNTWHTTETTPTLVEHDSYYCGYVGYRWTRTNNTLCINTGYTQIDYIERDSSHTARISDIGTTLTDTMKFQLKVYPTNGGGSHFIGNDGTNDKDDYRLFWAGSNEAGDAKIYYDYGDDGVPSVGEVGRRLLTASTISSLYEIEIGNYYVKDLTNNSYILSGDTVSNANVDRTIGLFGGSDYGRIYYLKVYEGSTLVKNFIPVRRNSDNLVTLYDTISGTYLSATDGTFKGSDE